jgi:tRNA dimethylallyltransferase
MFQTGLLDEVVRLREAGFGASAKAMESVGYRQAHAVLEGLMTVPAAIEETTLRSRQYAKRQLTWFRKTNETSWLSGFGDDPSVQAQAKSLLKQFLTGCIENPCR